MSEAPVLENILDRYGRDPANIISILQDIQAEANWLPEEDLRYVSAQLDKTFPTLDCSSCILTPKMVDVARHPNIELLTYSEVEWVRGQAGEFQARIRKKARSVKADACTGCGICTEQCPIRNEAYLPLKQPAEILP